MDINSTVKDGANPIDVDVEQSITHSKYLSAKFLNDIALVRLQKPVEFTSKPNSRSIL